MRKVADGSSGDIVTLFPARSTCTAVGTITAANDGGSPPIVSDTHELKPLVPDVDIDTVRRYEPLASEATEDGAPVDGVIGLPPHDPATTTNTASNTRRIGTI